MDNTKEKNIDAITLLQSKNISIAMWALIIASFTFFVCGIGTLALGLKMLAKESFTLYALFWGLDVNGQYPGICLAIIISLLGGILGISMGIIFAIEFWTIFMIRRKQGEVLLRFIDKWWYYKLVFQVFGVALFFHFWLILGFFAK